MKLSLKAVNGKLRFLAQRVGQGLKHVLDCCCETQGEPYLILFFECCDEIPRFAITQQVYDELTRRCPQVDPGQFMLVKFRGSENETCYVEGDSFTGRILREEAVRLGYTIYETADIFDCSRGDGATPNRCGWSECPLCYPNQCCLTELYNRDCTFWALNVNSDPTKNVCCNYGRKIRRTARYSETCQRTRWTFLNNAVQDSFCNIGCYAPLPRERAYSQVVWETEDEFEKCNDNGESQYVRTNLSRLRQQRDQRFFTKYGFDGDPRLSTCLSSLEEELANLNIIDDDVPLDFLARILPSRWPQRLARVTPGQGCQGHWFFGPGCGGFASEGARLPNERAETQCEDVYGHVFRCTLPQTGYRFEVSTERYTHSMSCNSGQYDLFQIYSLYSTRPLGWPENEPLCPPENTLLERVIVTVSCTYFIETLSRTYCDPRACDEYRRTGTISPITAPAIPPSTVGALTLL